MKSELVIELLYHKQLTQHTQSNVFLIGICIYLFVIINYTRIIDNI